MSMFDVSAEDLALDALVRPSWYDAELVKVDSKLDKNNNNMDFVTFKLFDAVDHNNEPLPNKTVRDNFGYGYEMGRAQAAKFLRAIGEEIGKGGKTGLEISVEKCGGKRFKIYVVNGEYDGRPQNQVRDYKRI